MAYARRPLVLVSYLLFVLICVVSCALVFLVYHFLSRVLKAKNKYVPAGIFSQDEKDIIYLRENAVTATNKRAVVRCNSGRAVQKRGMHYEDVRDCRLFTDKYESENACRFGCIGFGSCIPYCPQDAIELVNGVAVINENCTGCGVCVDSCPNHLIELIPSDAFYYVACAAHDGERLSDGCTKACTACGKCTHENGFHVVDNCASLDYDSYPYAGSEAESLCPSKCIVKVEKKAAKGFKFWRLCYSMNDRLFAKFLHKGQ